MRIALVLGSGGARGYAHMGAVAELTARGHEVVTIAGTSMGALVGGLVAAGKLDEFDRWARSLTQRSVLRLLDPTVIGPGMIRADRVVGEVSRMLDGARIEDLPLPFTAVATDLTHRREVWFQRGPLDIAIRASIAIPSVITPVLLHGRLLVDGGLTNPVPIEPTIAVPSDVTIAVSLSGRPLADPVAAQTQDAARAQGVARGSAVGTPTVESSDPESTSALLSAWEGLGHAAAGAAGAARRLTGTAADALATAPLVRRLASRFVQGDETEAGGRAVPEFSTLPPDVKLSEVVTSSLDTMQSMIERYRLAANPPDVLVEVPVNLCSTYDFHKAAYVSDVGRRLTAEALDAAGL
ncbi:MAG: patatin-like phospholipase family protein [Cellulomonadaceae bacterium]